jgi:site-specific DNA-methyltransferase (adenine-specific)
MIELLNIDCMEYMGGLPDKAFELAIVDPPYDLPEDAVHGRGKLKNRAINKMCMEWDVPVDENYFTELFRVSVNQCIWGGNYFPLPPTRGICIWDKEQPFDNFSAFELCWTSFSMPAKIFRLATTRTFENKIHPTQKPVKLYKWLLHNYAKPGYKILDTHLGSGSSAIAAHEMEFDFVGCEIDKDYCDSALKRYNNAILQQKLF